VLAIGVQNFKKIGQNMDSSNKHISTLLFSSSLLLGGVTAALLVFLIPIEGIQNEFNTELPIWLAWVFPSFRFWPLVSLTLLFMFAMSFKESLRLSPLFTRTAVNASFFGFGCAITFVLSSILAIYWPVIQQTS
jgi:hypothetical protein